eukprot:s3711_g3.t2
MTSTTTSFTSTSSTATTATTTSSTATPTLPRVDFSVPWSNLEAVSTQLGGQLGDYSATVSGIEGCNPPESCGWRLALVESAPPSRIVAVLQTSLETNPNRASELTLRSSEFRGQDLVKGRVYEIALLQLGTPAEMDNFELQPAADLEQAELDGVKMAYSNEFIADAPPLAGTVAPNPLSGTAVTTQFTATASGWVDEDLASVTYAFYTFPLAQNLSVAPDGGLTLDGGFVPPEVEWRDSTSPIHWSKLGGTFQINVSDPEFNWQVSMGAGSYFTAVVVRDVLGAISASFALGPLVEVPQGGLTVEQASAAIDTAVASAVESGDAGVIMGMMEALVSVPIAANSSEELNAAKKAAQDQQLEALKTASTIVNTDAGSLQRFGGVLTEVLSSGSESGTADVESAAKASEVLSSVLDAAVGAEGVDAAAGSALLGSIAAVGDSYAAASSDMDETSATVRAAELAVMTSKLGNAALATTPVGGSSTMSSVDASGKGLEINVNKESVQEAQSSGVAADGVEIPPTAVGSFAGRRLQSSPCDTLALQQTDWVLSNPYSYLNSSLGINRYVLPNATVKVLEIKACDTIVVQQDLNPPVELTLPLPQLPLVPAPTGFVYEPVCAHLRTSEQDPDWSMDVTSWVLPTSYGATEIKCQATTAGGAYVGIYVPMPLAGTSTTATKTVSQTSTTTFTAVTTTNAPSEDAGMIIGTSVAAVAFVVVISLCAWQLRAGNVKVNVPDTKATCQRMADSVKSSVKSARSVAVAPFQGEPKVAWEGQEAAPQQPQEPSSQEVKQAKEDAEEHFWDWAKDVAQASQASGSGAAAELPRGPSYGLGQSMGSTGPAIPRPLYSAKKAEEKEEYFQSFAQELRDIVGSAVPNMIEDSPSSTNSIPKTPPPPPPPKRSLDPAAPPRPPPNPPPWSREKKTLAISLPPPPAVENAERIDVRVDQAFSDWASDFALCLPPSPSQAKTAPPPPPPPRRSPPQSNNLPLPPPKKPSRPALEERRSSDPHEINQVSSLRSAAMASDPVAATLPKQPPPPPADRQTERQMPLLPPSLNTRPGSQLAMPVPKHLPLQLPARPPGAVDDDNPDQREATNSTTNTRTERAPRKVRRALRRPVRHRATAEPQGRSSSAVLRCTFTNLNWHPLNARCGKAPKHF